MPAVVV